MNSPVAFIEKQRKLRGLNPRQLATAAGMNVSTLHRILAGENEPRRSTLEPLARYFGVSVDEMFADTPQNIESVPARGSRLFNEVMDLPEAERAELLSKIAASLSRRE